MVEWWVVYPFVRITVSGNGWWSRYQALSKIKLTCLVESCKVLNSGKSDGEPRYMRYLGAASSMQVDLARVVPL